MRMNSIVPLLSDRVQISRVLILIGSTLLVIVGFINNSLYPEVNDPIYLRLAFAFIGYLIVVLSFINAFVKKHFLKFCYLLYFVLIVLFQYILTGTSFHPIYIFGSYVIFIGISLGINNIIHLRAYLAIYFSVALISVLVVKQPLFPVFNYVFQLLVLSILIYILIKSYINFQTVLEISNENFQTLINNADELYFLIDSDFNLLKINKKGKEFVEGKYSLKIEENDNIHTLFSTNELSFLIKNCNKAFKGETVILERLIPFPDKKYWYEIKFIPVLGQSKKKVIVSGLDISDKKRTMDSLKRSEAKFRVISDFSPLGVFMFDLGGKINYTNQNYYRITGLDNSESTVLHWDQGIDDDDLIQVKELYKKSIEKLTPFNLIIRFNNPEKGIIWTHFRASPIFFEDLHFGYVSTLEDISELKNANDLLQKSEKQFRDLFQSAPIGMVLCTLDGEVLEVNDAMIETLGFSIEELINKDIFQELLPGEFNGDTYSQQLLSKDNFDQFEKSLINSKAELVYTIITATLFTDSLIIFQILDITDRVNSEKLLEQKNVELLKINSELDAFVYSAAHDLRAPLTSILGVVNLIKVEIINNDLNLYLNLIEQSVLKLDSFISDIIDYSRNARTELKVEEINAKSYIIQILEGLSYVKEAQSINRIIDIDENLLIYTDSKRLQIILNNLISNSIRYHDYRKQDRFIRIQLNVIDNNIEIVVEDNGIGIEEKYLQQIFHMFFRASETSKGSGLGLYIVKEAINKLEGHINVGSKYGKGTVFSLSIPNKKEIYFALNKSNEYNQLGIQSK